MSKFNVHAGHSQICRGANGILDEVTEDRKVKDKVVELLRASGHTVYDCTDDNGSTASANLSAIVAKCNANSVDLDISIHLNAGREDYIGDGKTGGVEVWGYNNNTSEIGSRICSEVASALGITNRGFKVNQGYYVLRNTKSQAIIIECAFVDDADDATRWDANKCAEAIVKGLVGNVTTTPTQTLGSQQKPVNQERTYAHSIGESVVFSTCYRSSTDSISECITADRMSRNHGTITAIVDAPNPYLLDGGLCWVNDGDIRGPYIEQKQPTHEYYPKYNGTSTSIVDALISLKIDGSYTNREKIASLNGISDYRGSADQNNKLLSLLKQGKLIKA